MKVDEIWNAEYYRDGGSYAFMFDSDGKEYEFFIEVATLKDGSITYLPPVIYYEDCNSGKIVEKFTWIQAKNFLSELAYENRKFEELKKLVNKYAKEGVITKK